MIVLGLLTLGVMAGLWLVALRGVTWSAGASQHPLLCGVCLGICWASVAVGCFARDPSWFLTACGAAWAYDVLRGAV